MLVALEPYVDSDWSVLAGSLDWSCWRTAAHVAHDLLAYAAQIAAQPAGRYLPFDVIVRSEAAPADVLDIVRACGELLSSALDTATADTRAWHWGPTDPTGFAALGVTEILVHTWDICQGLGLPWRPPADACSAVLDRLRPDAPAGDPVDLLLWATGRVPLDEDHPRQSSWVLRIETG
jgi:hypothetical protein